MDCSERAACGHGTFIRARPVGNSWQARNIAVLHHQVEIF